MIVIGCENISFSVGIKIILSDISFSLNEGEKLGIVGVNGAGQRKCFYTEERKVRAS